MRVTAQRREDWGTEQHGYHGFVDVNTRPVCIRPIRKLGAQ